MPVEVYNNQNVELVSEQLLGKFGIAVAEALPLVLKNKIISRGILSADLDIEISIVDDAIISQVHEEFMDIPGATDVITFSHGDGLDSCIDSIGEIVISAETARRYGADHGNSFETELMLYIIHGLLHLAGHEDNDPVEREAMEIIQFKILERVWTG